MKTDLEIQKDVQAQLGWEPALNAAEIGVSVKDGVVTLSGQVDSFSKKITAEKIVKKVGGVKAIAEDIQVGLSTGGTKPDSEIAAAILNAWKWDNSLPEDKVKAEVDNGFVTLTGEVVWEYQKRSAKHAIENLTGVKFVLNNVTLKERPVPADVKNKIREALVRDATIDANKISVSVAGNKVILSGAVRSIAEKEDAEMAAWSAPGVRSVESKISVEDNEYIFD